MQKNPFQQLNNLYNTLQMLPREVTQLQTLSSEDKTLLKKIGLTAGQVRRDLLKDVQVQYDRYNLYQQCERALEHPLVGAATELYANYCTVFSPLHNATVWITSESPTYQRELTHLLDRIGIEEKIFDWCYTTGSYGDMFVQVNGVPGKGVISIADDMHPLNLSRVDHEGVLIGYYKTPLGQVTDQRKLLPPWDYVHFRLLGGKKKRPTTGDPHASEFRTMHLMTGTSVKQVTTKYGTSLLLNALPSYRRLRLAEDSLLLARLSRGLIRYVWKLKVDSGNMEAVGTLVDQYSRMLREARALDTREATAGFGSRENPMSVIEDLFIPVWNDVGDLTFDKIGGEADIRWIRDIEDLRQQLAAALRTPLPLLGAYLKEATGPLGSQAIEKLDINFARMARKLQRTVRNGVKRMCQIHLAYMNMDPDPSLFDVQMPEMSTAEDEALKANLKDGMEVIGDVMDLVDKITEGDVRKVDKFELFDFLSQRIIKMEDLDLTDFIASENLEAVEAALPECKHRRTRMLQEKKIQHILEQAMGTKNKGRVYTKPLLADMDLVSYVPTRIYDAKTNELNKKVVTRLSRRGGWIGVERSSEIWEQKFGSTMVLEGDPNEDRDVHVGGQGLLFTKTKLNESKEKDV